MNRFNKYLQLQNSFASWLHLQELENERIENQ